MSAEDAVTALTSSLAEVGSDHLVDTLCDAFYSEGGGYFGVYRNETADFFKLVVREDVGVAIELDEDRMIRAAYMILDAIGRGQDRRPPRNVVKARHELRALVIANERQGA